MDILSNLTSEKKRLINTEGPILALGGPGSGKTFISLLKAEKEIRSGKLIGEQHILFLSFARSTIARVDQQAGDFLGLEERKALEINTYHGFAWKVLRSHGYLINSRKYNRLLSPPEAASRLAEFNGEKELSEKHRLFIEEGYLHFDLFASACRELFAKSKALLKIFCDAYPVIILDEFQDTNNDEWQLIKELGKHSNLIALADPEQRIYEFRGADPRRIDDFISTYSPTKFDLAENHRSNGTDIIQFGNDLLTEENRAKIYKDVNLIHYPTRKGIGLHLTMKTEVLNACRRLRDKGLPRWSLAVLVPTKKLMLDASSYLESQQTLTNGRRLPSIAHDVAMDTEGPALAAVLIAGLLEGANSINEISHRFILDLCEHLRGRKGSKGPNQTELGLVTALKTYLDSGVITGKKRKALLNEVLKIAKGRQHLQFSGDPSSDWLAIRRLFQDTDISEIRQIATDSKYLRLLHKGSVLRSKLGELWRVSFSYLGATSAVRDTLLQEHFTASIKEQRGINLMTIHKSKGKEFDEVIIYEGSHQGRFVRENGNSEDLAQARLALRVAVTRAKYRTTIITPAQKKSPLL